jgi:hypothetical protein
LRLLFQLSWLVALYSPTSLYFYSAHIASPAAWLPTSLTYLYSAHKHSLTLYWHSLPLLWRHCQFDCVALINPDSLIVYNVLSIYIALCSAAASLPSSLICIVLTSAPLLYSGTHCHFFGVVAKLTV